ncbi:hypothetical protein [Bacillus sp. 166amftsu]|uniref:hypothetical protein n=1 Tax=Bacillus sp. 166amftsu TaxID=1761753 RepID=UPI001B8C06C7|nr:hypothetical protein [Bacillus sp. 166amftsu]
MSILIYGFKTAKDLTKQYQKLESVGNDIEKMCEGFIGKDQLIDSIICRKYQDAFFLFNRSKAV